MKPLFLTAAAVLVIVTLGLRGRPARAATPAVDIVNSFASRLFDDAPIIVGKDGNFYGVGGGGGSKFGGGFVYKVTPAGNVTELYDFNGIDDGDQVNPELVQAPDGNFYGTTKKGGAFGTGTIFRLTPTGVLTTLHSFQLWEGNSTSIGLTLGLDGNLYGSTPSAIFRVTTSGAYTPLLTTLASVSPLVHDANGTFYGTHSNLIFSVTPSGKYRVIYTAQSGDPDFSSGVTVGPDGKLYGLAGGSTGYPNGAVYQVSLDGTFAVIDNYGGFVGPDMLIKAADGSLEYADNGASQIKQISPSGYFTTVLQNVSGSPG